MDGLSLALVGLGGLYYISKDNRDKEEFKNREFPQEQPSAYPIHSENIDQDDDEYINKTNATQTTDKFYQNIENQSELFQTTSIESLNGNQMALNNFQHNNMVPFFGGSIKGLSTDANMQSVLDNYNGSGSQSNTKEEIAPLFKPEENVQWSHGMPNNNDYFQSHQISSNVRNNTKPWIEEQVGPGLGKGFNSNGSGGFNSGMEDRKAWMPKTVDELRVDNNPKTIGRLNGLEGPALSKITNLGLEGKIEKNRPDTDYILGAERLFTTTGIEKGQTAHAEQMLGHVNRPETNIEHYGITGKNDHQAHTAPRNYKDLINKPHCYGSEFGIAYANGENSAVKNEYGLNSYKAPLNNRNTTATASEFGIIGSVIGSVMAPVLDILRPSRKENILGNLRESGNIQKQGGVYVINPGDKPKTTIKEMLVGKENNLNIQGQREGFGAYKITSPTIIDNNRVSTNTSEWGGPHSEIQGPKQIHAYLNQKNNVNREQVEYTPSGHDNIFSGNINANICTNRGDCNNRMTQPTNLPHMTPSIATYGQLNTVDRTVDDSNRIDSDLLDAFKQNPYTHSIESY